MSVSNLQSTNSSTVSFSLGSTQKASAKSGGASFASTLSSMENGTTYTNEEVRSFFASKPDAQQIARKAASLGLSEAQIARAMTVGGYSAADEAELRKSIESFVADRGNGYGWSTGGALVADKSTLQATPSTEKAMPSAESIKAFYATNPNEMQITEKAKALGLNAAQMVQFQATGIGMNMSQISAPVLETMFVDSANRLGNDIGGGKHGGWTSYYSPTLGRAITKSEIQSFFASKPSQSQIFQKASELGLGVSAVNNMMIGIGTTTPDLANKTYGEMDFALYTGSDGYSLDQYGHIVPGGGQVFTLTPDGTSGSWSTKTSTS